MTKPKSSRKAEKPITLPPGRADEEVDEGSLSTLLQTPAPAPEPKLKVRKKTPGRKKGGVSV